MTGLILSPRGRQQAARPAADRLASMSAAEIASALTAEQRREIRAKLAAEAKAAAEANWRNPGYRAGFAAGNERVLAVITHPTAEGREHQAAILLGNRALSADEITAILADMPEPESRAFARHFAGMHPNARRLSAGEAAAGWKRAVARANAARASRHESKEG